jgi:transcriptional regulator with XRE-family HTH domain
MQLQATQVRAARAILEWSQEELADRSGIGVTTIRQIESGFSSRRNTTINLRGTFENAGLEFLENEGVRRRTDKFRLLEGADSCQKLYDEFLQAAHAGADEILACAPSYQVIAETLGLDKDEGRARVKTLCNYTRIKCLVHEDGLPEKEEPLVSIRYSFGFVVGRAQYYVFGRKFALIIPQGGREYNFIVFNIPSSAQEFREGFQDLWSGKALKDILQKLKQASSDGKTSNEELLKIFGHTSV